MHFCQDELLALEAFFASLPVLGFVWMRAKAWWRARRR
jgi:hypothetical protein